MPQAHAATHSRSWTWTAVLLVLLALRLPSLAQPAGGDQQLYSYVASRVLAGDVPYRDAWEQKPPGIFYVYAAVRSVWPRDSAVALADLLAAAFVAWGLVRLGRRMFGGRVGELAAAVFLLLGDPGIQRLAGMNVRAQCETFIAAAVTIGIAIAYRSARRRGDLVLVGICLGIAFWLKYNALVFAAPIALAALMSGSPPRSSFRILVTIAGTAALVVALGVGLFAAAGALQDLWLATISYNLAYSRETYTSVLEPLTYAVTLPIRHAFVDGLWFAGGLGAACLATSWKRSATPIVIPLAWTAAAVVSIAINGSRGLPQYFVQAAPALALTAAAGLALAWRERRASTFAMLRAAAIGLVFVYGVWRVGIEKVSGVEPRLFGLPQAFSNAALDLRALTGSVVRYEYLERFGRESGKFSPLLVEELADQAKNTTPADSRIYVFGFASGGVYTKSGRPSASRFFWSRPVVLEFERGRPGYGSGGLLNDLQRSPPSMVMLQKHDWGLAEDVQDSEVFFLGTPALRDWIESNYIRESENLLFSIWRRRQ